MKSFLVSFIAEEYSIFFFIFLSIISLTIIEVALSEIGQCVAKTFLAPALKKQPIQKILVHTHSLLRQLHADKITIFALIFKLETSDADKIPSFFIVVFDGGVNTKNGSLNPLRYLKLMRVLQMKLYQIFSYQFF